MRLGAWTRRWLAVSGGVLANGLILGALVLIEEQPPSVEETPVLLLDLTPPERSRTPERRQAAPKAAASRPSPTASPEPASTASGEAGAVQPAPGEPTSPAIDPAWRIDRKTIDSWRITEGVPEWGWGRYYRACKGLSSEHMTPDEKERCYGAWGGGTRDKRPSPGFVGPIDETKWQEHPPAPKTASTYDKDAARGQHCRDYRRGRTPGFSERNLASTGKPPPTLRERGCF
ncbi:hypothetical protein [Caulobacter sp. RL271]|jgi:hypothetical protein|uniref:Lectin-like protein BA14k n=1 Tax=Caulobacter segnis TaxID=88688 RepID=A0ABY4ZQ12_9CAUL|nr:hypothetical protein [Caulobacter segnis]USQ94678.1 hypothetical protein MZV50_19150 [Caulobacter segnis]